MSGGVCRAIANLAAAGVGPYSPIARSNKEASMRGIGLAVIGIFAAARAVGAQVTFDGCVDYRGIAVASVRNDGINDVAIARSAPNGAPIIEYNVQVLAKLQPQTRLFFYAHECAHHALAHGVRGHPLTREQEADCWAVRTLTERGDLDDDDM